MLSKKFIDFKKGKQRMVRKKHESVSIKPEHCDLKIRHCMQSAN